MSGFWSGVAAYTIWGLVLLYWKLLKHVPAIRVLGHRIVWSLAVLVILVAAMRRGGRATLAAISGRVVGLYAIAAGLIAVNWFLYIYAVNAGFIVETSLGYYITPLVNVLFGVVVFHERMRPAQWVAIAIAAVGVVQLTFAYGALPWIAFGLAASFGKKKAPLDPVEGLTLETAILAPVAILFLVMLHRSGGRRLLADRRDERRADDWRRARHDCAVVALRGCGSHRAALGDRHPASTSDRRCNFSSACSCITSRFRGRS